jgi:hypothetical protein
MKKINLSVLAILAMVLVFALAQCGTDDEESEGTGQGIEELEEFLDNATGGGTPDDPIKVKIDNLEEKDWEAILAAIAAAGKYVDLDITECQWGTVFDPGIYRTGEKFIVGFALPNAATSIKEGMSYGDRPTFRYFEKLKTLSAAKVTAVGDYAFYCDNTSDYKVNLTTVSLPMAISIGVQAFTNSSLETVSLPKATDIGDYAFAACYGLTEVSLPEARSIGEKAFSTCTSLTEVSLPKVESIDVLAFYYCTSLTKVSLPATPPVLVGAYNAGFFRETSGGSSSMITITVPNAEAVTAYKSKWGEAEAGVKPNVYGSNHKAVTIEAAAP